MKLILINGPAAVGKSTLAERLHKTLPLSFYIDIDLIRRSISDYRKYPVKSWELSMAAALGIAEAQLRNKNSIIIDKMIYNKGGFIDSFINLGKKYKADTYEFILWAKKDTVIERAEKRGYRKGGLLTREKTKNFWLEIEKLIDQRKRAIVIDTDQLTEKQVFNAINRHLTKK